MKFASIERSTLSYTKWCSLLSESRAFSPQICTFILFSPRYLCLHHHIGRFAPVTSLKLGIQTTWEQQVVPSHFVIRPKAHLSFGIQCNRLEDRRDTKCNLRYSHNIFHNAPCLSRYIVMVNLDKVQRGELKNRCTIFLSQIFFSILLLWMFQHS